MKRYQHVTQPNHEKIQTCHTVKSLQGSNMSYTQIVIRYHHVIKSNRDKIRTCYKIKIVTRYQHVTQPIRARYQHVTQPYRGKYQYFTQLYCNKVPTCYTTKIITRYQYSKQPNHDKAVTQPNRDRVPTCHKPYRDKV